MSSSISVDAADDRRDSAPPPAPLTWISRFTSLLPSKAPRQAPPFTPDYPAVPAENPLRRSEDSPAVETDPLLSPSSEYAETLEAKLSTHLKDVARRQLAIRICRITAWVVLALVIISSLVGQYVVAPAIISQAISDGQPPDWHELRVTHIGDEAIDVSINAEVALDHPSPLDVVLEAASHAVFHDREGSAPPPPTPADGAAEGALSLSLPARLATLALPPLNISANSPTFALSLNASLSDLNTTHVGAVLGEVFTKRENASGQVLEMRGKSRVVAGTIRSWPEWARTIFGWKVDVVKPLFVESDILFTNTSKYQFQLVSTVWNTTSPFPFPSPHPVLFTATASFFNPFPLSIAPQGWTPLIEVHEWIREERDVVNVKAPASTSFFSSVTKFASTAFRSVVKQAFSGETISLTKAIRAPKTLHVSTTLPEEGGPGPLLLTIFLSKEWSVEREANPNFVTYAVTNQPEHSTILDLFSRWADGSPVSLYLRGAGLQYAEGVERVKWVEKMISDTEGVVDVPPPADDDGEVRN
ncbi:hypothetical protein M427DRAFT_59510 [Gonapodya prolifera JEL478]|uniref:Uncharacterized protein n=1 Tax=Gonapodya prolifera (strain JEL478) TaxID=1344416 RepID=A0A139A6W7_GONPJ|nr:hypothetical protein M427DRAFT_59510 [Gonapodya prolifera JEL478]|eukprot:KXS12562.1 hypothetical protein M427DRAFT_59510 [Gonapodya prolifera JEL478]